VTLEQLLSAKILPRGSKAIPVRLPKGKLLPPGSRAAPALIPDDKIRLSEATIPR
jgi:hypothetical protein